MEEKILKELLREVIGEVFEEKTAIFVTKDDLKAFITKEEFLEFERRLTDALNGIREGVRLSLYEIEKRLGEIESKLRFYDFNFAVNQNDAIMRTMKDIYQELTFTSSRLREHDARLSTVEAVVKR